MSRTTSTPRRAHRTTVLLATGLLTTALAVPAFAVTATMGSTAVPRPSLDTWTNSTTVDTNHPAPFDGYFTQIEYDAGGLGEMRFVVIDADRVVTWVSDPVTVTAVGAGELVLDAPVGVTAGSNLGVYTVGAGVVGYEVDTSAATILQTYGGGVPAVNSAPAFEDPGDLVRPTRIYSMNAEIEASSPQICKDGGWRTWGYKNQGQCIASVVADEHSGH